MEQPGREFPTRPANNFAYPQSVGIAERYGANMNAYKRKISDAMDKQKNLYFEIQKFSSELALALDLTPKDIDQACDLGVEWNVGAYTIYPVCRPSNNWWTHLEARPNYVTKNIGYTNNDETMPATWHFVKKGTATEILPDEKTRQEILKSI